jgi:hypothetical protein
MPDRSPVITWLLLAATMCVNAVAYAYTGSNPISTQLHELTFFALLSAQLSLVCIWLSFHSIRLPWATSIIVAALVAAAALMTRVDNFWVMLAYFSLQVVVLLVIFWFVKRTEYWARRSGNAVKLRFSMAHLLLATTAVAIMVTVLRLSGLFEFEAALVVALSSGAVLVAVVSVLVWSLSWHWVLRLAATFAFAMLLGLAYFMGGNEFLERYSMVNYLTQAVILSAWLGLVPVLPMQNPAAGVASPPAS